MKEARKALETSSLGRKPRFRLSQLIQSVLMTRTTTDVREMSTVLRGGRWGGGKKRGEERRRIRKDGRKGKRDRKKRGKGYKEG